MKLFSILFFLILTYQFALGSPQAKVETFVIKIEDRGMMVLSPAKKSHLISVLVENRSLSDQVGKFIVDGKILKYVSIKSGHNETVEFENKTAKSVFFVPVAPPFQEAELVFGKKVYEIPSKK